jgi:diguanylate cyclase (GGDEF)-like protein
MIEVAALTLAGALIIWITLITPTIHSIHLSGVGEAVLVAGWVGDVVVLAATVRMLIVWPRNPAVFLLSGAVLALLVSDVLYGVDLIYGRWRSGGLVDLGLLIFFGFTGVAARSRSVAALGSPVPVRDRVGIGGLTIWALALLVAPSALIIEATSGRVRTPDAVAVVSVAIGGLVWWRMILAGRARQRAVAREVTVRQASQELGLATDANVVTVTLASALKELVDRAPTAVHTARNGTTPATFDAGSTQLNLPVDTAEFAFTAPAAELCEVHDALSGLSDQAVIALQRIDLADRMREDDRERDRLAYRASHDALTGLANAATFRERLRDASHSTGDNTAAAVLFVDLDDFKTINDTLGHEAGDAVLVVAAQRITAALRDGDVGARLGGDEFAVLLPQIAGVDAARGIAQRLIDALAAPATVNGLPVTCRASIGLALAADPDDFEGLLRHADTALYAAKSAGKGQWRLYQPAMPSALRPADTLHAELERLLHPTDDGAADNDGLSVHYQPILELVTGAVWGYEALIRWAQPHAGPVATHDLIDAAERSGLMPLLADWTLSQIATDMPLLASGREVEHNVGVNVSATQLRRPEFTGRFHERLAAGGITPSRLVIEVTENQLLAEDDHVWEDLAKLRQLGTRIAIDDYGTGYASLAYLRQPTIDIIKLDSVFLRDIDSERDLALLHAVIDLSRKLGNELIAAGITQETDRSTLIKLGCRLGQGQLFAPAMPIADLLNWVPPRYVT